MYHGADDATSYNVSNGIALVSFVLSWLRQIFVKVANKVATMPNFTNNGFFDIVSSN